MIDGIFTVNLNDLKDQDRIEYNEVNMLNQNDEELMTLLNFEVNWIYSRVKLYSDQIIACD